MAKNIEQKISESMDYWELGDPNVLTEHLRVLKNGHLAVKSGKRFYDVFKLAKRYGRTRDRHSVGLDIILIGVVRDNVREIYAAFEDEIEEQDYEGDFEHCYPLKSQHLRPFVESAVMEGSNLETGSYNELQIVKYLYESEIIPRFKKTIMNGPKNDEYIQIALQLIKKRFNVIPVIESKTEFDNFLKALGEYDIEKVNIGIRVRPGVVTHSHWDSATERNIFGLSTMYGAGYDELVDFFRNNIKDCGKVRFKVLHAHAASQIEGLDSIKELAEKMALKYVQLKHEGAMHLNTIDLGGGLAVPYRKNSELYSVQDYAKAIIGTIKDVCDKANVAHPNILIESGRYVAATAQLTVAKVIDTKDIYRMSCGKKMEKRWLRVNLSVVTDLPDAFAVEQYFHVVPVNGLDQGKHGLKNYLLAGMSCDSSDVYPRHQPKISKSGRRTILSGLLLPNVDFSGAIKRGLCKGEQLYVAFLDTGAYQDLISGHGGSHHCGLPDLTKIEVGEKIEVFYQDEGWPVLLKRTGWKDR